MNKIDPNALQLEERVLNINRITKVVKGGRRMRFSALVVVGDHNGHIGFGTGKAQEVPAAIKKAIENAKGSLIKIPMAKHTIPHEVIGKYGAGKVMLKPAAPGTGILAGGPARVILELSGIQDILSKSLGSNTPINMVRAVFDGFANMYTPAHIAELRGKTAKEILEK